MPSTADPMPKIQVSKLVMLAVTPTGLMVKLPGELLDEDVRFAKTP
jgi:hypothetical protein